MSSTCHVAFHIVAKQHPEDVVEAVVSIGPLLKKLKSSIFTQAVDRLPRPSPRESGEMRLVFSVRPVIKHLSELLPRNVTADSTDVPASVKALIERARTNIDICPFFLQMAGQWVFDEPCSASRPKPSLRQGRPPSPRAAVFDSPFDFLRLSDPDETKKKGRAGRSTA